MKAPGPTLLEVASQLPLVLGDRLTWMTKLYRKYGDIVRIPLGPMTVHVLFHPDMVRHVLTANASNYWKGRTFEKTTAYLGRGLATAEGPAWQTQRRRMNPPFQRDALRDLVPIMVGTIEDMLERWRQRARQGASVDLSAEFQRLAMEVVARALFGRDVPQQSISRIIAAMKIALKHTARRTMCPINIPDSLPLPSNLRFRKAIETIDQLVYGIIDEEKKRDTPSKSLLSLLLRARDPETGEKMSDKQLRDEVTTIFVGGTDTSGNTLSWVCYNLHHLPHIRARVEEEIEGVLQGRRPGAADLDRLDYTPRVIEETLRLFPQNWLMSRDAYADDVIGGYDIPAGSTVFPGVYVIHRRPDFWDVPETFDPDRFSPERAARRHSLCYLPFGAGSRKCIGYPFAMMEFRLAIAMIVQSFRFELINAERIKPYATWSLWPSPNLRAVLRPRSEP
jgi:cytochrome P450